MYRYVGVSGLTCARLLQRSLPHASITLLEASERLGGLVRTSKGACGVNMSGKFRILMQRCGGMSFNQDILQYIGMWNWNNYNIWTLKCDLLSKL